MGPCSLPANVLGNRDAGMIRSQNVASQYESKRVKKSKGKGWKLMTGRVITE